MARTTHIQDLWQSIFRYGPPTSEIRKMNQIDNINHMLLLMEMVMMMMRDDYGDDDDYGDGDGDDDGRDESTDSNM